jgi:CheY-like chemotaxis protein
MMKRSIFYLDDNEDMLKLFSVVCGDRYDVRTASSLSEGLAMLNACSADIIISDQRMPEMEGTEFLRRAHELCPKSLRIDSTRHLGVQVRIATEFWNDARPESQHRVELGIVTSYEPLARFSRDLKSLVEGRIKEVILEGDLLP